jgi:hypothetical protein
MSNATNWLGQVKPFIDEISKAVRSKEITPELSIDDMEKNFTADLEETDESSLDGGTNPLHGVTTFSNRECTQCGKIIGRTENYSASYCSSCADKELDRLFNRGEIDN